MRVLRTVIALAALCCALVTAPPRAEAKGEKVDRDVAALRTTADKLSKAATSAFRALSSSFLGDSKSLAKQAKKGAIEPQVAFDTMLDQCSDFLRASDAISGGLQAEISAAFELAIAAAPGNLNVFPELEDRNGNVADRVNATVDAIRNTSRTTADLGCSQVIAVLDCLEFDTTCSIPRSAQTDSLQTSWVRRKGGLPDDVGAAAPEVLCAGATCVGTLRIELDALPMDTQLQLYDSTGAAVGGPRSIRDVGNRIPDLPAGTYLYRLTYRGQPDRVFSADVPKWEATAPAPDCAPTGPAAVSVEINAAAVFFPPLSTATATMDQSGKLKTCRFVYEDPADSARGRVTVTLSAGVGREVDLSGEAGTRYVVTAGDAFVFLRIGAGSNRSFTNGTYVFTNLKSLLGSAPTECIGVSWEATLTDYPNPGSNNWSVESHVRRELVQ